MFVFVISKPQTAKKSLNFFLETPCLVMVRPPSFSQFREEPGIGGPVYRVRRAFEIH